MLSVKCWRNQLGRTGRRMRQREIKSCQDFLKFSYKGKGKRGCYGLNLVSPQQTEAQFLHKTVLRGVTKWEMFGWKGWRRPIKFLRGTGLAALEAQSPSVTSKSTYLLPLLLFTMCWHMAFTWGQADTKAWSWNSWPPEIEGNCFLFLFFL